MAKKINKSSWIAFALAFLLKYIIYAIGGFSFSNSPLFSLYTLYDFGIYIICVLIIQYVITIIMAKKGQNK